MLLSIFALFSRLYKATVMAPPAEGPSFGTAPSGQCICIPLLLDSLNSFSISS